MTSALLGCGLSARYGGRAPVLSDVRIGIDAGEAVAVIGRSGSGKSTLARLLAGVPPRGAQVEGRLSWPGGAAPVGEARRAGLGVGWLPQDAHAALHPMLRVGSQIAETLRAGGLDGGAAAVAAALRAVGLDPALARRYPHQVSGGQAQRAALACALAHGPAVLIADEPTSALDAVTAGAVLDLLAGLTVGRGVALLLVSHDLDAVGRVARRVVVLDGGRVAEQGAAAQVLSSPRSDAARRLVDADAALRGKAACCAHAA